MVVRLVVSHILVPTLEQRGLLAEDDDSESESDEDEERGEKSKRKKKKTGGKKSRQ